MKGHAMNGDIPFGLSRELRGLKRIGIAILVVLLAGFAIGVWEHAMMWLMAPRGEPVAHPNWHEVRMAIDSQFFHEGLSMAMKLTDQEPGNYYGHSLVGRLHLAMGEVEKAEKSYAKAYALFPSEENLKALEAVRRRLAKPK